MLQSAAEKVVKRFHDDDDNDGDTTMRKEKSACNSFYPFFFLKEGTTVRGACINKLEERSASKSSAPSTLFASHGRVTFVVFCLQNKAQKKKKLKL